MILKSSAASNSLRLMHYTKWTQCIEELLRATADCEALFKHTLNTSSRRSKRLNSPFEAAAPPPQIKVEAVEEDVARQRLLQGRQETATSGLGKGIVHEVIAAPSCTTQPKSPKEEDDLQEKKAKPKEKVEESPKKEVDQLLEMKPGK